MDDEHDDDREREERAAAEMRAESEDRAETEDRERLGMIEEPPVSRRACRAGVHAGGVSTRSRNQGKSTV